MKVINGDDQSCEQIDERVTHHAKADKFDSTATANPSVGHLISTATAAREISSRSNLLGNWKWLPKECRNRRFGVHWSEKTLAPWRRKMKRFLACLVAAMIVFIAVVVAAAQSKPPLRLVQTIPLPDLKEGDFDHFAMDLAGNRLFLTAEANNAVEVLDTSANKLIHTIPDLEEPHSMLFLPAAKQLWAIAGGAAKIFNSDTYALTETVKLTEGADSSAYDPAKHLLYVAAGGADAKLAYSLINIVDTTTRKKVGDIKVASANI